MDPSTNSLLVRIGEVQVGTLTLYPGERIEFSFLDTYRQAFSRPILGQKFEDDLFRQHTSRMQLPPFFSNLLPEGPLRELIAKKEGVPEQREFFLIARIGQDLPGAVVVEPGPDGFISAASAESKTETPPVEDEQSSLHFSLAGVQLKFSMLKRDRGLTLPVSGKGGDWIAKLPDGRYPLVPETEFSTMSWARAAGIEVPEFELIPVAELTGLPEEARSLDGLAFAVKRFDRGPAGVRVHMEEFAQIFALFPAEKYRKYNYESIARVLLRIAGVDAFGEFIRRFVFVVASGNSDAHHKNWALVYPDGKSARLSPAYDLVSTIPYLPQGSLALNFAKSKRFEDISLDGFRRLARLLDTEETALIGQVNNAVEAVIESWQRVRSELPISELFKKTIEQHWRRVPLLSRALSK